MSENREKTGYDDLLCPCGSGKPFIYCHGRDDLITALNILSHRDNWRCCPVCGFNNTYDDEPYPVNYCGKCGSPLHEDSEYSLSEGKDVLVPIRYCIVDENYYNKLKKEKRNLENKLSEINEAAEAERDRVSRSVFAKIGNSGFLNTVETILKKGQPWWRNS